MTTMETRTDVSAETAPEETSVVVPPPSARLRRAWLLVDVALVALVLAALVLVGLTARGMLDQRADDRARSDALAAARQLALSFTSLDYRTFDRDAQRVADAAGGQLRQQFTDERSVLKKAMTTNKSVTRGRVLDAAVVDSDRDSARVLLVVDADVTNTSTTEPAARHYRMQLDMSHAGGRWLGTDLTFVG
jgi:Mce-associated membrane protein